MQCVHSCDGTAVAASLSNREIKLFDRNSLAPKVRPFITSKANKHGSPMQCPCDMYIYVALYCIG